MPGVNVTRVLPGDDPAVGAAFTEAVNVVLASRQQCPDVSGVEERIELSRIGEMAAEAQTRSVPG